MSAKLSVLAGAVGVLLSASPLLASDAQGEHFLKESIQGNLAEVQVGTTGPANDGDSATRAASERQERRLLPQ
jgi:hypothetical protein